MDAVASSSSAPNPNAVQVVEDRVWEENPRNPRKRLANTDINTEEGSPLCQRFVPDNAVMFPALYNAIRTNNEGFVELLMEFISDSDLRKIAGVCCEWNELAYQVIRRRIGGRVFSLLFVAPSSTPLCFSQHFHQGYLQCRKAYHDNNGETEAVKASFHFQGKQRRAVFDVFGTPSPSAVSRERRFSAVRRSSQPGYMNRIGSRQLSEVQAIISFGNANMENEFTDIDNFDGIPPVEVFVFVVGCAVFFTTPDIQKAGDSDFGIYEDGISESMKNMGGKFMSSFCFPESSHFRVCSQSLNQSMAKPNKPVQSNASLVTLKSVQSRELLTKVIIVFKLYDCEEIQKLLLEDLNTSFRLGANSVSVISGEFLYVGAKSSDCLSNTLAGISLNLLGDKTTSTFTVEISEADMTDMHSLDMKFHHLKTFIDGCGIFINYKKNYTFFAFLIAHTPLTPAGKFFTDTARAILQRFRQNFPRVPIHGIGSDKPITSDLMISPFCDPATRVTLELSQMQCGCGLGRNRNMLMVLLVVKYPHSDGFTFVDKCTPFVNSTKP